MTPLRAHAQAMRAAEIEAEARAQTDVIEVRRNPDGTLDEIVASGCLVHLEQMDNCAWFLAVEKGGRETKVWFRSTRKIETYVEVDGREATKVKHASEECADG